MPLSKQDYEEALSRAAGSRVMLTDTQYQKLVSGQKLSDKEFAAAKMAGASGGAQPSASAPVELPVQYIGPTPSTPPSVTPAAYMPKDKGPEAPASSSIGKIAPASMGDDVAPSFGPPMSASSPYTPAVASAGAPKGAEPYSPEAKAPSAQEMVWARDAEPFGPGTKSDPWANDPWGAQYGSAMASSAPSDAAQYDPWSEKYAQAFGAKKKDEKKEDEAP